ncbi:hypothetical protein GCM10028820_34530 [Tessaracoccus terricola]
MAKPETDPSLLRHVLERCGTLLVDLRMSTGPAIYADVDATVAELRALTADGPTTEVLCLLNFTDPSFAAGMLDRLVEWALYDRHLPDVLGAMGRVHRRTLEEHVPRLMMEYLDKTADDEFEYRMFASTLAYLGLQEGASQLHERALNSPDAELRLAAEEDIV